MHSTGVWASQCGRSRSLPSMPWPLSRIQFVLVLPLFLFPLLFLVGEQWKQSE